MWTKGIPCSWIDGMSQCNPKSQTQSSTGAKKFAIYMPNSIFRKTGPFGLHSNLVSQELRRPMFHACIPEIVWWLLTNLGLNLSTFIIWWNNNTCIEHISIKFIFKMNYTPYCNYWTCQFYTVLNWWICTVNILRWFRQKFHNNQHGDLSVQVQPPACQ